MRFVWVALFSLFIRTSVYSAIPYKLVEANEACVKGYKVAGYYKYILDLYYCYIVISIVNDQLYKRP